ncbi:MAG: L-lactate dehydrogenase [Clostridiales bacterium]|nr:L-lactate dehydrogenase [Clostridiales bacterium]
MAMGRSKVVIIGAGNVGTALAHHLVIQNVCSDLRLIDMRKEKVWAEVMDLRHSMGYSQTGMNVEVGSYEDCHDADIVVFAVSAPYKEGMTRLDMQDLVEGMVASITRQVIDTGFQGIFVVITNPVDVMTYLVQRVSGFAPKRVIGTGSSLDSARLCEFLADRMKVDSRSVVGYCMGEHGNSQFIPWSQVSVGGKRILDILEDNPEQLGGIRLDEIQEEITQIGNRIMRYKGATNYGIAAVAARIIKAVLLDERIVLAVSVMPEGEYGITDVYVGIPAVLNRYGVTDLVEYHLTPQEQGLLEQSVQVLREANGRLHI